MAESVTTHSRTSTPTRSPLSGRGEPAPPAALPPERRDGCRCGRQPVHRDRCPSRSSCRAGRRRDARRADRRSCHSCSDPRPVRVRGSPAPPSAQLPARLRRRQWLLRPRGLVAERRHFRGWKCSAVDNTCKADVFGGALHQAHSRRYRPSTIYGQRYFSRIDVAARTVTRHRLPGRTRARATPDLPPIVRDPQRSTQLGHVGRLAGGPPGGPGLSAVGRVVASGWSPSSGVRCGLPFAPADAELRRCSAKPTRRWWVPVISGTVRGSTKGDAMSASTPT